MLHDGLQPMGEQTVKKTSTGRDTGRQAPAMVMELDAPSRSLLTIRPVDAVGLLIAAAASGTILVNALLLQTATRPAEPEEPTQGASESTGASAADAGPSIASAVAAADPLVKEVQAELSRRGLYEGTVDGLTGRNTQAAIRTFESSAGLPVTGETSPKLLSALRQTPAAAAPSDEVLQVQRALVRLGMGTIKADGVTGEATRSAIRRFETSHGLKPQGDITPALKKALFAAAART
jgi:peptidoglycan hydrolase-like protein with peptidoglycan-binding domain